MRFYSVVRMYAYVRSRSVRVCERAFVCFWSAAVWFHSADWVETGMASVCIIYYYYV